MLAKESKRLMILLAAAAVSSLSAQAGAVQTFWSRGAGTDDLLTSLNWLGGSHPAQTAEAVIDDLHGGATYTTPGVRYFGGTGGGQKFGQLTLDSPTLTNLYAYSSNITTTNPVTLWATPGSDTVLSIGPNVGATAAQSITITDNPGVNGSLYLALNFTPVAANDPAIINVTNANATLKIGSLIRNDTTNSANVHGIEKTGSGTLVLTNTTNSFGGANQIVRVSGGTLSYIDDKNLGSTSNSVVLNGGTLQFATTTAAGTITTARAFNIAAASSIDLSVNGSFLYQINGAMSGSASLTKTGTTELALNNAAGSYSGTLTVNQGSIRLLNPKSVAGATIALNAANSTLDLRNDTGGNYNVNIDASTKNAQIYVDHQTGTGSGGLFQLGNLALGPVTLNLNGSTTTVGNSMQLANVTLTGSGTIQTSAIPVTISGAISETGGAQSLKKMGAATLTLTQPSPFTGGVTVGGGTLSISDDSQLGSTLTPVTVATDYTPTTPNPATLQITGSYTTARPVLAGDGTIDNAQNVTLGAITGTGSLVKTGAGNLTVPSIVGGALSVNNGVVTLAANGGTSLLTSFGFATGQLDATNNQLIFRGPSASSVRGWLSSTGGIISSTAQADSTGTTAIGYLPVGSAGLSTSTWGTQPVLPGDIVTKLTYTGDINLDGVVNADDFALMDRGLAQNIPAGSATWQNGDLNYDGVVDSSDFMLADKSFALHGGTFTPAFLSERESMFGSTYVSNLIANVPEPASTSIVLLTAGSMMSLRRKRVPKESR